MIAVVAQLIGGIFAVVIAAAGDHPMCGAGARSPAVFRRVKDLKEFLPAQAAAVAITIPGFGKCSGAYVSDAGHVLTANHCLTTCGSECILELNGISTRVRVLMRGLCTAPAMDREHTMQLLFQRPKTQACTESSDVAIILPDQPVEPIRCLPVSLQLRAGEPLYTLGYPDETDRGSGDSNGKDLYRSDGEIIPPHPRCTMMSNSDPTEWVLRIHQPGSDAHFIKQSANNFWYRGFVQTTLDIVSGNSGGPLINASGEIVAVATGSPFGWSSIQDRRRECRGSTFFAPLRGSEARSKMSDGFTLKSLICRRVRATGR